MHARAATWWTILRISFEERLVYRGDFALGTVMRFLPIVTQMFLWWAVFEAVGEYEGKDVVAGYTYHGVVVAMSGQTGEIIWLDKYSKQKSTARSDPWGRGYARASSANVVSYPIIAGNVFCCVLPLFLH